MHTCYKNIKNTDEYKDENKIFLLVILELCLNFINITYVQKNTHSTAQLNIFLCKCTSIYNPTYIKI